MKVLTNTSQDQSWIGQTFYVDEDAKTDGSEAYQLYTDAGTTGTGVYVKIYTECPDRDISITVTDGTDPVQGASVVIGDVTKTTGSAGGCTVNDVTDGKHEITVTKTGFEDYSGYVTVNLEQTSFTITLTADDS